MKKISQIKIIVNNNTPFYCPLFMIYDHHRGALQSNQQNMHDTPYCVIYK